MLSPIPEEILCECTHLTTFAAGIASMAESDHFKYIIQLYHSTRFYTSASMIIVAVASSLLLKVCMPGKHC